MHQTGHVSRHALTLPLYLAANATSLFGNAAINIVLPWLVLERTGSPALAGTVAAVSAIPSAIAAFVGGHLIDRFGRRAVSVISDIGSAVSVAGLAIVDRLTGLDVTWFILLGIAGALFDLPGMTARETLVANVAHTSGRSLDVIAGWRQAIFGIAYLIGPAITGILLRWLPAIQVVWITATCSAIAALLIAVMPLAPMTEPEQDAESPLSAWATVRSSPAMTRLLVFAAGSGLLVTPLLAVLLPAHFQALGRAEGLGLSLSAFAVGMVVGSGVHGAFLKKNRSLAWYLGLVLFTVAFIAIAFLHGFWLVALGMLLAGVAQGVQGPVITVLMTEHVPEHLRGRVFGLMTSLNALSAPIGLGVLAVVLSVASLGKAAWLLAIAWLPLAIWISLSRSLHTWLKTPPAEGVPAQS